LACWLCEHGWVLWVLWVRPWLLGAEGATRAQPYAWLEVQVQSLQTQTIPAKPTSALIDSDGALLSVPSVLLHVHVDRELSAGLTLSPSWT